MTLQTYSERTRRWIPTACVMNPHELIEWDRMFSGQSVGSLECSKEANKVIEANIESARLAVEIERLRASTRAYLAKQGGTR
jgi:hypothetical protein